MRFLGIEVSAEVPSMLADSAAFAAERMAESGDALLDVLGTFGDLAEAFRVSGVDGDLKPEFYGRWVFGPDFILPDEDGDTAAERRSLNRAAGYALQCGAFLSEGLALPACVTASIDREWKRPGVFAKCFMRAAKADGMEAADRRAWLKSFASIPANREASRAVFALLDLKDSASAKVWARYACKSVLPAEDRKPKSGNAWFRDLLGLSTDEARADTVCDFLAESDDLVADDLESVERLSLRVADACRRNRERITAPIS